MQSGIGKMKRVIQKQNCIQMNRCRADCILSLNPPGVKEKEDHQELEKPGKTC